VLRQITEDQVVNECGKSDVWPVIAQSVTWGYGASGTHGFGSVVARDRFHPGGHSQYFEEDFVKEYWVPFIRDGMIKPSGWETTRPGTPWWLSTLGWLPLKYLILICAALTLSFVWWIAQQGKPEVAPGVSIIRATAIPQHVNTFGSTQEDDLPGQDADPIPEIAREFEFATFRIVVHNPSPQKMTITRVEYVPFTVRNPFGDDPNQSIRTVMAIESIDHSGHISIPYRRIEKDRPMSAACNVDVGPNDSAEFIVWFSPAGGARQPPLNVEGNLILYAGGKSVASKPLKLRIRPDDLIPRRKPA